jgi:hypothetical protein
LIGFSIEIFRAWPRRSEHAGQTMITLTGLHAHFPGIRQCSGCCLGGLYCK